MTDTSVHRASYDDLANITEATNKQSIVPPHSSSRPFLPSTSLFSRVKDKLAGLRSIPWFRFVMVGGVIYTVIWSVLLYFGWKGSPQFITWADLVTGVILLHLAYQLYKAIDISQNRKVVRLIQLASLLYATTWTLIVMFVFGVEILLPLDFVSLYVTISLMRQLWRSFRPLK